MVSLIGLLQTNIFLGILSFFLFYLVIGTLLLMLVAKIFKQKNVFVPSIKVTLVVSLIGSLFNLISPSFLGILLLIGLIVFNVYLIKKFFNVDTGKAVGMWFVELAFGVVLILIGISFVWSIVRGVVG